QGETLPSLGVFCQLSAQDFESYRFSEAGVNRLVHLRHAAARDPAHDLVLSEVLAVLEQARHRNPRPSSRGGASGAAHRSRLRDVPRLSVRVAKGHSTQPSSARRSARGLPRITKRNTIPNDFLFGTSAQAPTVSIPLATQW